MKTSLIQRAKFEDRPYRTGIDSIIHLDYMGSTEFETGTVFESLSLIRESLNEYTYLDVPIRSRVVTVFCPDKVKSEVMAYLNDLADYKMRLQEYSDFDTWVKDSEFKNRTDFWWDLTNHLMFWKKNNIFEIKFKLKIVNNK
jgi:hypothetical protein